MAKASALEPSWSDVRRGFAVGALGPIVGLLALASFGYVLWVATKAPIHVGASVAVVVAGALRWRAERKGVRYLARTVVLVGVGGPALLVALLVYFMMTGGLD